MLEYGINFNTEEGRAKAQKEIEAWRKKMQSDLNENALKFKIDVEDSIKKLRTNDAKKLGVDIDSLGESVKKMRSEFRGLTLEEAKSGKGQELINKYRNLKTEAGIFAGTIDQAVKAQDRMSAQTGNIERQTQAYKRQSEVMTQLKSYAMNFLSVYGGIRLTKNLIDITGEFEMQRVSLSAILQDAQKGEAIFDRMKELAVVSPFQLKDLTAYAKQLSAFSVPYEELYDTTKMLADVSAGLGVDMSRIILAYGQVRSAAVLRGQELRQFTEAGIPLVDELAKKFTALKGEVVSASEVFDLISQRQVPFEMIKDIFTEMTSEGGKFYNMQEKQAETLAGKVANLTDAFQIMLAEIGKKGSGILKGSIDSVRWLMTNYDSIGRILLTLVSTYGAYRTAMAGALVAEKLMNGVYVTKIRWLRLAVVTQNLLNKAMLTNPYVLLATAVTGLATAIYLYTTRATAAERATGSWNKQIEEQTSKTEEEKSKLQQLINVIKDETSTRLEKETALKTLQSLMPSIFKNMDIEGVKLLNLTDVAKQYNEQLEKRNLLQRNQSVESGRALLNSKVGDARWSIDERQQALSLMGKSSNLWAVMNTPTGEIVGELKKWVRQGEEAIYEIKSTAEKAAKEPIKYDNIEGLKKALTEAQTTLKDLQNQASKGLIPVEQVKEQEDVIEKLKNDLKLMGWSESKKPKKETNKLENDIVNAENKLAELQAKMALEIQKYNLELEQASIDNMAEGSEKRIAQIELEKKRDLLSIEERKQAMLESNREIAKAKWESEGKKGVFSYSGGLTSDQGKIIQSQTQMADIKEIKAREDLLKEVLDQYQDYATRRLAIEKKLNEDIAFLEKQRTAANGLQIDAAISEAKKDAEEKLSSIDLEQLKNSDSWKVLFSDLNNYTSETLKKSLADVEKTDLSTLNPQDAKAVQQAIDKLKDQIAQEDPFWAVSQGWKDMVDAINEKDLDKLKQGFNRLEIGVNKFMSVLDEVKGLSSTIFGEDSDATFALSTVGDVMTANVTAGSSFVKFMSGDFVGGIKDGISAVSKYINVFKNIRNRKWEKEIKRQQEIIDGLTKEYENLDAAIKKTVGNDYYKTAQQQSENLKKQAAAVNKQLEAEKNKGSSKDKERIKQLEQDRDSLYKESAEIAESVSEKIAGTDLTSAAQDFAQAWLDAYVSFGNTSDAIRDKFKDMAKNMVIDAMLSEVVKRYLEPVYDLIDSLSEDGDFSAGDISKVVKLAMSQTDGLDAALTALMAELEKNGIDIKNIQDKESNLTGISKNAAEMSEDAGLVLAGTIDSLRVRFFTYAEQHTTQMASMLKNQNDMTAHLIAISHNTLRSADSNDRIETLIKSVISPKGSDGAANNINIA